MLWGSDRTPDFLAWEFYRNTPWQFPFGIIENYSYPNVTSVGLTGSIPALAIPFKLLNPILPEVFQYFGLWLFSCYLLQGLFAVKLLKTLHVENLFYLVVGASFFVIAPVLLDRTDHMNLCSHWLILAGFWIYLDDRLSIWKKVGYSMGLILFSALDHPYLILFTLALGFGILCKEFFFTKKLKLLPFLLINVFNVALVLGVYYAVGNFVISSDSTTGWGYGFYSANLNGFFNSLDKCKLFPIIPMAQDGQYEGYAYLGFGIFLLFIFLFYKRYKIKVSKSLYPLLAICVALFIFSLSNKVTFFHKSITLPLPDILERVGNIFRATGRFVWTLYYLFFLVAIVWLARLEIPNKTKNIVILVAFLVQILDVSPLLDRNYITHREYNPPLNLDHWDLLSANSDKMIMYPPFVRNYDHHGDFMYFAHQQFLQNKKITAGHLARFDENIRKEYTDQLNQRIQNDELEKEGDAFIVTTRAHEETFKSLVEKGRLRMWNMDNYLVYLPAHRYELIQKLDALQSDRSFDEPKEESMDSFLIRNQDHIILMTARDEASRHLCDEVKARLKAGGSKIDQLEYRGSYYSIFSQGKMIFETIGNKQFVSRRFAVGEEIRGLRFKKEIYLESAGMDYGNRAKIIVDGRDYSLRERGLNIVVLNAEFNVIEVTAFDTFEKCSNWRLPAVY